MRLVAALVLAASVVIMATDLIRMSIVAAQHLEALQLQLDKVPPLPGAERAGVMRTHKSRVAAVSEKYVGPAPRPHVFDHYRKVFEAAGWRSCGRSITHEDYCRGDYVAIVSLPSALGAGSYSVTLQWNRITWRVWLIAAALITLACSSLAVLTRHTVPGRPRGGRSSLRLRSRLAPAECVRRLEAAARRDIIFHRTGTLDDGAIGFGLERRQGRWASSVMAPYFHGRLQADPATGGTIVVGSFGFHPRARGGMVTVVVIALLAIGLSLRGDGWGDVEWALLAIAVGIAGLILARWTRRQDRGAITTFLATTLDARPIDSGSTVAP